MGRFAAREDELLDAALHVLIDVGYDRLTMDAVAARAHAGKATLYRRWDSKAHLVVDLIDRFDPLAPCGEPDTGSLRADLMGLACGVTGLVDAAQNGVVVALATAVRRNPELAAAFDERFLAPRMAMMTRALLRARDRGELADGVPVDLVVEILPSLVLFRLLLSGALVDDAFVARVVDEVVIPLSRGAHPGPCAAVAAH